VPPYSVQPAGAVQQGALENFGFFLLIVAAAVLPGGDGIAGMALALSTGTDE
jgi:hypothetical protein